VRALLYFLFEPEEVNLQVLQDPGANPLTFTDKSEQEVFGPDVVMAEPQSFLTAQPDDILNSIREISFHYVPVSVRLLVRSGKLFRIRHRPPALDIHRQN
jgi:hypothetical protein